MPVEIVAEPLRVATGSGLTVSVAVTVAGQPDAEVAVNV